MPTTANVEPSESQEPGITAGSPTQVKECNTWAIIYCRQDTLAGSQVGSRATSTGTLPWDMGVPTSSSAHRADPALTLFPNK